jgi:hypothetical protein
MHNDCEAQKVNYNKFIDNGIGLVITMPTPRTLTLKSGKTITVSSLEAIEGTVWVKKIAYRKSKILLDEQKILRQSLVDAVEKHGVDKGCLR